MSEPNQSVIEPDTSLKNTSRFLNEDNIDIQEVKDTHLTSKEYVDNFKAKYTSFEGSGAEEDSSPGYSAYWNDAVNGAKRGLVFGIGGLVCVTIYDLVMSV